MNDLLREHGWTAIADLLDAKEIEAVNTAAEHLLALPAEHRHPADKVASGTRIAHDLTTRNDLVADIVTRPPLRRAVEFLLGQDYWLDQAAFRSPGPTFGQQYLHADDAPKLDDGPTMVTTAIVALVDFTETNGATRVVPGSHRRIDLQRQSGSLDRHQDEICLVGSAGTAFVFSGHLLHSGTRNNSGRDRPALQLVWRRR